MSTRLDVHFSSRTPEWSTPDDLFAELNGIFHFDLDACASPANAKCTRYFTKEQDALRRTWRGTVWMNPPYGREIAAFMRKAHEESLAGATVVCLVPSRTDTDWWHRYAKRGQVIFLRGRLKFGGLVPGARVHSHPVFSAREPVVSPRARADSMAQRDQEWSSQIPPKASQLREEKEVRHGEKGEEVQPMVTN